MVDPIATPAAVVLASSWFANKLLGPAADTAGQALGSYVNSRIGKIFKRAEQIATPEQVGDLPIGFVALAVQKASFSEDSELLTDMWARLLVDASQSLTHRHSLFADILSQIGTEGARLLNDIWSRSGRSRIVGGNVALNEQLYARFRDTLNWAELNEESAMAHANALLRVNVGWPVWATRASYTFRKPGPNPAATGTSRVQGPDLDLFVVDSLAREKLVEQFSFDFQPGWASPQLSGVYMTMMGVEFIIACSAPESEQT